MRNLRTVDPEAQQIDYHLNLLGVRVWEGACQLIAREPGKWVPIGPKRTLPINIPHDERTLDEARSDALCLTAWQFEREYPASDIRAVLSGMKNFQTALNEEV